VIVCGSLAALVLAVLVAPPHPLKAHCLRQSTALLVATVVVVGAFRGGLLGRTASGLVYRIGLVSAVVATYFMLRDLLPVASPGTLDPALYHVDVALFGGEPALWLEPLVTPATTEWFAFWYLAYFFVLAAYTLPLVFSPPRTRLATELCLGIALTFCTAHLTYLFVPGVGPYHFLADRFRAPLPAGRWMATIRATVDAGGALKDIFPSLHVAAPTMFALFAFRHRREWPFGLAWPLTAFAALNGIVATMFLRWHYAVDVVAGLMLAVAASVASARLAEWECARRAWLGRPPAWPPP